MVSLATLATVGFLWPSHSGLTDGVLARRISLALACWLLLEACLWVRGTYTQVRRRLVTSPASELGALATSVAVAILVALAVKEVLPNRIGGRVPTDLVVASLAVCAVVLPLARAVILASLYRDIDVDRRRVVVVGSGTPATDAAVRLERSARVQVVGFVDDDPAGSQPMYRGGQPMLGGIDSLAIVCRHTRAGRVLVLARDPHEGRNRCGPPLASRDGERSCGSPVRGVDRLEGGCRGPRWASPPSSTSTAGPRRRRPGRPSEPSTWWWP